MENIEHERFFFNTFGYHMFDVGQKNIILDFEKEISEELKKPYIGIKDPYEGLAERDSNIRYSNFKSDKIYDIFYNPYVLDEIYKITDDFVICSALESFYIYKSQIHRDTSGELKTIKLLFYLDNLSDENFGPLYVIPGTQNIYDKYSSALGDVVSWPPLEKGYCGFEDASLGTFLDKNLPKKYLLTNSNKILMFNTNILHGSDGNLVQPKKLRRCIAMTIICVDRKNEIIMKKINNFFKIFNINNKKTLAYEYCKKYNRERWLKHFFFPIEIDTNFQHSQDGTETNAIVLYKSSNKWANYMDNLNEINMKEKIHNTIFNCYKDQLRKLNKLIDNKERDIQGL